VFGFANKNFTTHANDRRVSRRITSIRRASFPVLRAITVLWNEGSTFERSMIRPSALETAFLCDRNDGRERRPTLPRSEGHLHELSQVVPRAISGRCSIGKNCNFIGAAGGIATSRCLYVDRP
jgi:hypothetical protein